MVNNMNHDTMIAPYTTVDYNSHGDIQGQTHYVRINGKSLVLGFEPFHSMYILLRLLNMTVVKCVLVNTKIKVHKKELLPRLTGMSL